MVLKQQLQVTVYSLTLLLVTVTPLVPAQSLQLVYISRPDDNRILLECRRPVTSVAVTSPQIWVERFDLARQRVTIVGNQAGTVAIEITQDLEGFYSCSYNGDRSSNTLKLVARPQPDLSIPSSYVFQAGLSATINCRVKPGKLRQYYSVRWMNGSSTIITSTSPPEFPRYQLNDNFSLTINNIKLGDSSTSYRCAVTIDDPNISGTNDRVYNQLGRITVNVYVLPHIVIPPEPRVIAVVRGGQPNTTFICEATGVPTPRISWMHNGRNISQSIDDRFQADITVSTGGTVRSMLNATHLRGRDSGRIDCVAYCIVSEEQPLSFSNTTLSVLTGDFEMIISVTSAGDVFFRINLQDGYHILDQTRLLMRYTSEINSRSRNMTSEQAFVNASSMFLEVPRSRVPYPHFRVQVALQVGNKVGQFVSNDATYDITRSNDKTIRIGIIAGSVGGGVVLIVVLLALVICIVVLCKNRNNLTRQVLDLKRHQTDRVAETVQRLINKDKSSQEIREVTDILLEQFREIFNARINIDTDGEDRVDGVDEVDGLDEEDGKHQILINFINDMNTLMPGT